MNEVSLHSFLGRCTIDMVESIFPTSDKRFMTASEVKDVMVFEDSEGNEQSITFWYEYLSYLEKYQTGTVHHTWHVQTAFCQYYYVTCAPWTTLYSSKDTYLFCFCLMSLEKPSMTDLCCFCTATNNTLLVKFDEGKSRLPFAETCFYALTLPNNASDLCRVL